MNSKKEGLPVVKAGERITLGGRAYIAVHNIYSLTEHYCQNCDLMHSPLCDEVRCDNWVQFRKEKLRVYISGQITGADLDERKTAFARAARLLTEHGYEAVSPFDNGLDDEAGYDKHMRADIRMLTDCDMIYMLRGWEHSNGARLEHSIACACGIRVLKYE